MFFTACLLKILDFFGCHLSEDEQRLHVSREFKNTFKDIKIVKKSKQNTRLRPSVNLLALISFIISATLVVLNLEVVSGFHITSQIYERIPVHTLIPSEQSFEVVYTAILFSVMSFSISKLMSQWKETREIRKTKKQIRLRDKAFRYASSKQLLDAAKLRDTTRYNDLKEEEN